MKCPKCKAEMNVMDMILDDDIRILFDILPRFQGHSRLAWEYAELFGVAPIGKHTKKLTRLLAEVAALFEQQKFRFQKQEYQVSVSGIVEGLRTVCGKAFAQPLENHNYLKKVLIGIADREQKGVRDAQDRALRAREESGIRRAGEPERTQPEPVLSAAEYKKRHGVESLAAKIGQRI
jgi:hypothetical protein